MKIKYSPHATLRIRQRYVSKEQVRLAILDPDSVTHVSRNRLIVRKKLNGKTLEIIYVIENNQIVIITLYHEKAVPKN